MNMAHLGQRGKILFPFLGMPLFQKSIISTPADFHNPGQYGYGIGLLLPPDKVVSYSDSLAKKAAAFFKRYRSILSRWTSFRSFCSSSFSGVRRPLTGKAFFPSEASRLFQRFNTLKRFQYFFDFWVKFNNY